MGQWQEFHSDPASMSILGHAGPSISIQSAANCSHVRPSAERLTMRGKLRITIERCSVMSTLKH
jgi:hypothetical protein